MYIVLKDAGIFQQLGGDLLAVVTKLSDVITEQDVTTFKAYSAAGMTNDQAVDLLLARNHRLKTGLIEFFEDMKRKIT